MVYSVFSRLYCRFDRVAGVHVVLRSGTSRWANKTVDRMIVVFIYLIYLLPFISYVLNRLSLIHRY